MAAKATSYFTAYRELLIYDYAQRLGGDRFEVEFRGRAFGIEVSILVLENW